MSILTATCATLAAVLASAQGGETITLEGECGRIEIAGRFPRKVTIAAERASATGLVLSGANVGWRGGIITAPKGRTGWARDGYGVHISGTDVSVSYAIITDAKKGMVIDGGRNVRIDRNTFWRVREDGINASRTVNLTIDWNTFSATDPVPSQCALPDGLIVREVAKRDCAGTWVDGDHAGAVQMRNGVVNARIRWNLIDGKTSGIAQQDTTGDAPLQGIVIEGNRVATREFHQITLQVNCIGCRIERNVVRRGHPDRKAVIRSGAASRCGNDVQDDKPDQPCKSAHTG